MTGKRFTSERTDDYNFSDILDNGKWIGICHIDSADDFVRKFNELVEENEQLKQQLRIFEDGLKSEIKQTKITMEDWHECLTDCRKLKEENEQLKHDATVLICSNQEYREENEQLKKENNNIKKILEEMGLKND